MTNKLTIPIIEISGFVLIIFGSFLVLNVRNIIEVGFTVGLALIALGLAVYTLGIGVKSEMKMRALAELNFVEKNAMIFGYLAGKEKPEENRLKRTIRDLEAGFKVIDWVKDTDTKNNFIDAFIELSGKIKNDLKEPINKNIPDIQKFVKVLIDLLEKSKKFDPENEKLKALEELICDFKKLLC